MQLRQHVWVRVAVVVVLARTDDRVAGPDCGEELGQRGRPAVVGDLQQARTQEVGAPEQIPLPRDLDVPGEQDRSAVVADPQDQRGVVQFAVGPAVRTARRRGEDVDGEFADHGPLPGLRLMHRDVAGRGGGADPVLVLGVFRHRPVPQCPDRHVPEHLVDAPDVVGVRMAEHEQVDPDAPASKPPPRRVVPADVDQDPRAAALDQDGVPLADVDGGDGQGGRQTGWQRDEPGQQDHRGRHGRGPRSAARRAGTRPQHQRGPRCGRGGQRQWRGGRDHGAGREAVCGPEHPMEWHRGEAEDQGCRRHVQDRHDRTD